MCTKALDRNMKLAVLLFGFRGSLGMSIQSRPSVLHRVRLRLQTPGLDSDPKAASFGGNNGGEI